MLKRGNEQNENNETPERRWELKVSHLVIFDHEYNIMMVESHTEVDKFDELTHNINYHLFSNTIESKCILNTIDT